jgi:two-component system, NtrC family, response regulator AtoC
MAKIFVVEDDVLLSALIRNGLEQIPDIEISQYYSAEECLQNLYQNPDIVTVDYNLPGMDGVQLMDKIKAYNDSILVIAVSGQDEVKVVVNAYKKGAQDYIVKDDNTIINLINSIKNLNVNVQLRQQVEQLKEQIIDRNKYSQIIGTSMAILRVMKLIQKVESNNIMVLISGESGTGKELVAKAIHYNSPRKKNPFVTVNMGAIPEELIESELFGHEKGAFTDARDRRIGKFEEANQGTIFLDEIGEMNLNLQTKLLRVLQEKEVVRIGGNKTIKLDVRVLAATNKNLTTEVKEGRFRQDLYYRLQGFLIHLPPLQDRGDDIILLAKYFLKDFCMQNKLGEITLSREVCKVLLGYEWPGNVRELKAVIERAAILCENKLITEEDIMFSAV